MRAASYETLPRRLKAAGTLVLAAFVTACASPLVYSPDDTGTATGRIEPLAKVLSAAGTRQLRLVFVHGVGDHCKGYALDPAEGWLDDKTASKIGLTPKSADPPRYDRVQASVFIKGSENTSSYLEVGKRAFTFKLGASDPLDVEAIEITWSHTTQWLKSNYLGYDSPSVTPRAPKTSDNCVDAENAAVPDTNRPPSRLILDRVIKEQVFDRNLADAIIYSGTYGEAIERAFADALCRSLVSTATTLACDWSAIKLEDLTKYRYVFVTHSLGSRIVYDGLLNLAGIDSPGRPNKFREEEWKKSRPAAVELARNTPAVLMMANQLALLGLANAPILSRDDEAPKPLFVQPGLTTINAGAKDLVAPALAPESASVQKCKSPLSGFALMKKLVGSGDARDVVLRVVAFNDTNDLLTWHIPRWYSKDEDCDASLELTNVFVRNAFPWIIAESPTTAHSGYFRNPDVWQAIVCGAEGGRLLDCAH